MSFWCRIYKKCMVMTHALINFSLGPHLVVWGLPLWLRGKGMVIPGSYVSVVFVIERMLVRVLVSVHVHVSVILCIPVWVHVHLCVAPPTVVGAWLMAETLWQLLEYYYYCCSLHFTYAGYVSLSCGVFSKLGLWYLYSSYHMGLAGSRDLSSPWCYCTLCTSLGGHFSYHSRFHRHNHIQVST